MTEEERAVSHSEAVIENIAHKCIDKRKLVPKGECTKSHEAYDEKFISHETEVCSVKKLAKSANKRADEAYEKAEDNDGKFNKILTLLVVGLLALVANLYVSSVTANISPEDLKTAIVEAIKETL